mgnify:CR=1 FL=1
MRKTIKVKGMHCSSCEILLKETIEEEGINVVSANHKKGEIVVDVKDEKEMAKIKQAVKKEGYVVA